LGLGAALLIACDPGPESKVGQSGGGGGSGGAAGTLSIGLEAGSSAGGSNGGGGATSGAAGTAAGGNAGASGSSGGASSGGSSAGSASGGSAGSEATVPCMRAPGFDADCVDLFPDLPQAYTCSSLQAASTLNGMHNRMCGSISLVEGGKYNECCPP
jgi:hypothetical protein